jgi:hypothetical protein
MAISGCAEFALAWSEPSPEPGLPGKFFCITFFLTGSCAVVQWLRVLAAAEDRLDVPSTTSLANLATLYLVPDARRTRTHVSTLARAHSQLRLH